MAIAFTRYVNITSGVGGGAGVRTRDLIARLFTTNELLPTKSFIEFENPEDVGTYFGTTSEEYKRAQFYFGWISKNITKPEKISYARWANADTAPQIFGAKANYSLASFTGISTGAFSLTLGATTHILTGIDFTGAASLAAVAAVLQAAIRTQATTMWTSATVVYDATRKSFNFEGGSTGNNVVVVANAGSGVEIAALVGWLNASTILSDGVTAETVDDVLTESSDASNNFGSFLFMPTLSDAEILSAATWNDTQNNMFQYHVPVLKIDAEDYFNALSGLSGVGVTVSETANEYPEMFPMMILAATNYDARNSVQNFMFQQADLTPSVTTTLESSTLDSVRANYYGRTQTAGQFLDFYQRGILMGLATDAVDMNTYANEQWLKDSAGAKIMELLLALSRVSANVEGRAQLISQLQSVINQALFNGTISVGKTLTNTQILFITNQSGDPNAWRQVQTIGYWLDCVITSYVTPGPSSTTEYKAVYSLIYSKDDAIRKVEGRHVLI